MTVRLAAAALLVLSCACHRGPKPPRFAIEVPGADGAMTKVVVPEEFESDSRLPLKASGFETLDLSYSVKGDAVQVNVFAMHQEYDPRRHATIFRSQKLGTHTARVRQSVKLDELARLGAPPITLRVVANR